MACSLSRAALAALALVAASGCAFGNRHAKLYYPPPGEPAPAAVPAAATAGTVIALQPVTDERPEPRTVIGAVRNGLYMHTADVVTEDDVAGWATFALRHELERLGVRVVDVSAASGAPVLGSSLSRLHCNAYFTYSGEVTMRAWVKAGEGYTLDGVYAGQGSSGTNWAATAESYGECVSRAMQDAARRIAADAKQAAQAPAPPPAQAPPPARM